jgi:hypothetical protein
MALFSLSASARSRFLSATSPTSAPPQPALFAAVSSDPSFAPGVPRARVPAERPIAVESLPVSAKSAFIPVRRAPLDNLPTFVVEQGLADRVTRAFEEVNTPFLRQVCVPLISLSGGWLQLSAFQSSATMQNLMWGLPAPAGLPLRASASKGSAAQQCHPGIRPPSDLQSYGLSLRLRFSKEDADRAGNGLWKAARQVANWGRAFFML